MGSCSIFFLVVGVLLVVIGFGAWIAKLHEIKLLEGMSPDERSRYLEDKRKKTEAIQASLRNAQQGPINTQMICPHCQSRGGVRTKQVTQKMGISGTKATAAVFTAGVSMLATGLSRKEGMTEASCQNCGSVWRF
jgi:DNA-directed RNA polymerase subunit M/transcription elongation factor TFIIS